jgi:hypothetical protein
VLAGPLIGRLAKSGLEAWNGATVDLGGTTLDLAGGKLALQGLAMADPQALETDAFRARTLTVDLSTGSLLGKRFVIDQITSAEAASGAKRQTPGKPIGEAKEPPPAPPGEGKTLEDWLKEADVWKKRLQQASGWLEKLSGSGEQAKRESPAERGRRQDEEAAIRGLASVVASHLIEGAPMVLIKKLTFEGVVAAQLGGELIDVHASNLSSNPSLVDQPLELTIRSRSGNLALRFALDAKSGKGAHTELTWKGLPVDSLLAGIRFGGKPPAQGGTVDLSLAGDLTFGAGGPRIDLPLQATLLGTTLAIAGMSPTKIDSFTLPIGLRGPLGSPRISIDDGKVADALVAAGKRELADAFRQQAGKLLPGDLGDAAKKVGDLVEGKKSVQELLDEAKKQAAEEARKRAADELEKRLPGGLFGPKKH